MVKIHTRLKRKMSGHSTHSGRKSKDRGSENGPKTFKTEGSAHEWAKNQGMKEGSYKLEPAKKNKKFKITQ